MRDNCPLLREFLQLPEELLVLHITAKAVFCFGLGAVVGWRAPHGRAVGWTAMACGLLMAIPGMLRNFGKAYCREGH